MHFRDHELLGDEPLYCEADHDTVMFSGSENDYYEAPETRRLRIEAKAVQFLNGNVPYLLSSRLEGPFDKESWTNPWRSKRTERQDNICRTSGQRTIRTMEEARVDVTDETTGDLPNTQRTSLYPLPSPETTDPPSARKDLYLDKNEYDWIREWREDVNVEMDSTPADPFCVPLRNADSDSSFSRKRALNDEWLRKDKLKKRKSIKKMTPPPAQSPSRTAAQARKNRIGPESRASTFAPQPSSQHGNVTTPRTATASNLGSSSIVKAPETTYNLSRTASNILSRKRVPDRGFESSEDELSMPSTTPSGRASRLSVMKSATPDCSPTWRGHRARQAKKLASEENQQAIKNETVLSESSEVRNQLNHIANPQPASGPTGISRRRAHSHSQQDSSFCFHNTRTKPPVKEVRHMLTGENVFGESTTSDSIAEPLGAPDTALSGVRQLHTPKHADEQEDNDKPVINTMKTDNQEIEPISYVSITDAVVMERNGEVPGSSLGVDHVNPTENSVPTHGAVEVAIATTSSKNMQDTHHGLPQADFDTSGAEWSTLLNTQDLPVVSTRLLQEDQHQDKISLSAQRPDEESDSDWETVITTQNRTTFVSKSSEAADVGEYSFGVEQTPGDNSESEWSTFLNSEDQSSTIQRRHGSSLSRQQTIDPVREYESDSDWSTCTGVSLQIDIDQTDNIEYEPLAVDLTLLAAKSVSKSSNPTVVVHIQDADVDSDPEADSRLDTPIDTVSKTSNVENHAESERIEVVSAAKLDTHASSALEQDLAPVADQELVENKTLEMSAAGAGLFTNTKDESRIGSQRSSNGQIVNDIRITEKETDHPSMLDSIMIDTAPTDAPQPHPQSPWSKEPVLDMHAEILTATGSNISSKKLAESDAPQEQSPWSEEYMDLPVQKVQTTQHNEVVDNDRSPDVRLVAGQPLLSYSTPQSPWMRDELSSPDFSSSVKKFSEFMKPSPVKRRSLPNHSILRSTGFGSNILFKARAPSKAQRHVTFASLPGKGAGSSADPSTPDQSSLYIEEDISYLDGEGKKTSTVRVIRPTPRPASPPPHDISSAEAGTIPDHDQKFARHFEAMSRRKKNPPQRAPRLLPSDSPQMNSSQEVGAMAEAFIQASQTRRKGLELSGSHMSSPVQTVFEGGFADGQKTPLSAEEFADQENATPVDDVSAVLDNLGEFFDNTWGVNLSMDEDHNTEPVVRHMVQTTSDQGLRSASGRNEEPIWGLDVNVWAD